MMSFGRGPLTVTRTVEQLLFEGYSDPLLTLVRANNNPDIPKVSQVMLQRILESKNGNCERSIRFRSLQTESRLALRCSNTNQNFDIKLIAILGLKGSLTLTSSAI